MTIANALHFQKIALKKSLNLKREMNMKRTNIILYRLELHPTFQVDGVRFTWAEYDNKTPPVIKAETTKDKRISLCCKMHCASDITEEKSYFM